MTEYVSCVSINYHMSEDMYTVDSISQFNLALSQKRRNMFLFI